MFPEREFLDAFGQPGQGSGGPPDCAADEATGTPVEVIPVASCEGFWLGESDLLQALNPLFQTTPRLYGVLEAQFRRYYTQAEAEEGVIPEAASKAIVAATRSFSGRKAKPIELSEMP